MQAYLLHVWDRIRSSYWFVPCLLASAAIALALITPEVDSIIEEADFQLPGWALTTTNTARTTLSTLTGAMVAVIGTVFSITIVTLSLTSQQFGPRLLRRFMVDLPTQITLGVFLANAFYCLLILRVVENRIGLTTPHVAVFTAIAMTVLSMAMLIYFIHHIAILIQAPQVVAAVATDLDDAIERLFPQRIGDPVEAVEGETVETIPFDERDTAVIRATTEGYIQAIDSESLLHSAGEQDVVFFMNSRPGDFIARGMPLADVWSANGTPASRLDLASLTHGVNESIIVGIRRTPRQDLECAIDELVEVAVRSLSPGINDPFTAMNCVDRLGASLARLAQRELPSPYRRDDDGRLRIVAHPIVFLSVLDAAFNQIRQYSRDSVAVTIRLLEALIFVADQARREADKRAVLAHAKMIVRNADSFSEERDREHAKERLAEIQERLGFQDQDQEPK